MTLREKEFLDDWREVRENERDDWERGLGDDSDGEVLMIIIL